MDVLLYNSFDVQGHLFRVYFVGKLIILRKDLVRYLFFKKLVKWCNSYKSILCLISQFRLPISLCPILLKLLSFDITLHRLIQQNISSSVVLNSLVAIGTY